MMGPVVAWLALTGWVIIVVFENIAYYRPDDHGVNKARYRAAIVTVVAMLASLSLCWLVSSALFS